MPHILTNAELDELCNYYLWQADLQNIHMAAAIEMLYKTGVRVGELNTFGRLSLTGTGSVAIITEKSNYIRVVDSSYIPALYYNRLVEMNFCEYLISPLAILRFLRNYNPYAKVMNGNKECISHLFRHNRVRTLFTLGWNKVAIGNFMGQMASTTVDNYLYDDLIAYP